MFSDTLGVDLSSNHHQYTPRPPDDGESSDEDLEGEEKSDDNQDNVDALSDTGTPSDKRRGLEGHATRKCR